MSTSAVPRVVYWNNMPSPYAVGRFNALAKRGNVDFEAWFSEVRGAEQSWAVDPASWQFRARYIPEQRVFGHALHLPFAELRSYRPDLIVSGYDQNEFALGSIVARAQAKRMGFRVQRTFDAWSERTWWRELGKHLLFRAVDGAEVAGADAVALAGKYGLPAARTSFTTSSIDVSHYQRARAIDPAVRAARRAELNLHGCVFVYVGRLWSGKGLDYLLEAYRQARQAQPDISLLIIGNGVDEQRYREQARDLPGVVFTGFVQPREIPEYYGISDTFVIPTLGDPYAVVVIEAMAAGLPVICTEAIGEIRQRLPEGEAGYIVPAADAAALADRMLRLAGDPALRERMGSACASLGAAVSHEAWAIDFERCVQLLLDAPQRRTPASLLLRGAGQLMASTLGRERRVPAPYVHQGDAYAS